MQTEWQIKPYEALSIAELYDLLRLRSDVFIVEQNCAYADIDGKDAKAFHLLGYHEGRIVGYARLFKPGDYFDDASIGRVAVDQLYRNKKLGHELMRQAISGIQNQFNETRITISAQLYLKRFYETHGFAAIGATYLEDDIPHIKMVRDIRF